VKAKLKALQQSVNIKKIGYCALSSNHYHTGKDIIKKKATQL
jgi:hypothetical protein